METAAVRGNRKHRLRVMREEQSRVRLAALDDIRGHIVALRGRRREVLARIRRAAHHSRLRLRESLKLRRERAREILNREIKEIRHAEGVRWALRRAKARWLMSTEIGRAQARLAEQRHTDRVVRRVEAHKKKHHAKHVAAERRAESDDEVRGNIESELVPIFDAMRGKVRARPGMSRTEVFVHWIEENPGEVWAIRERQSGVRLRELLREEKAAHRAHVQAQKALAKCKGKKCRTRAPLALAAGEVPF